MKKKYEKALSRRIFLRGAGTVAIALPLLDAMRTTSVYAATPAPPVRAFNLFFGLGYPTPLQAEGYDGPMGALVNLKDKLSILRGVSQTRCDENGINAHFDGAAGAFTAEAPNGEALAGGPSLDWLIRQGAYPNGLPSGVMQALLAGTYFRRSRPARYVHSWKQDGSPADLPKESPAALFDHLFGTLPSGGPSTPEEERAKRYRKSVLDSVMDQYSYWTSEASNLGPASRARIKDHLDRVREHEQKVFGEAPQGCTLPEAPTGSTVPHGNAADPDGQGIDLSVDDLVTEWRLMADLYALGVQCDLARFGALTFQAAGERIRLKGDYHLDGKLVYAFDDKGERGVGGDKGCSHEWWHEFGEGKANNQLRAHITLMLAELAYFMKLLDDPNHADENGQTILENSLVTISTESGDGRHSDAKRELSGVFHAITGANGRFKTGGIIDVDGLGLDLYNTLIQAHGIDSKLGPSSRSVSTIGKVLA